MSYYDTTIRYEEQNGHKNVNTEDVVTLGDFLCHVLLNILRRYRYIIKYTFYEIIKQLAPCCGLLLFG